MQTTSKVVLIMSCLLLGILGCDNEKPAPSVTDIPRVVPRVDSWGIYALDLTTEAVELVYSTASKIDFLNLNKAGDTLAFSQQFAGNADESEEICTIRIDGGELTRVTDNNLLDIYPVWSPDGTRLAFLSWRDKDLDIYVMGSDGSNQRKLYDSGSHDADIDWLGSSIVASTPVKGFALTLLIGVVVSMFTAIVVTRTLLRLFVGTRLAQQTRLFSPRLGRK